LPPVCWLAYGDMHQFELPWVWSPVRVVAESEPIHQTSRQAAQRAPRAWPATHQFEKHVRRALSDAENFHLDTKIRHAQDDDLSEITIRSYAA